MRFAIEIVGAVCVDAGGFFIGAKTFNDYGQTNSEGYPMKTRAAVAFEAKKPLEIVELDLQGPKDGEVLIEIMATGICHTDAYTLDGLDSEGLFPSVLGHEGALLLQKSAKTLHSIKAATLAAA